VEHPDSKVQQTTTSSTASPGGDPDQTITAKQSVDPG
jgi:hypothetical protein